MVYHPSSLELAVYSKKSNEDVLEELDCPVRGCKLKNLQQAQM